MLRTRVITSVASVLIVAIVLFVLPKSYAEAVIALLMLGAAWEWAGFLDSDNRKMRFAYVILAALLLASVYTVIGDYAATIFAVACAWWMVAFLWVLRFPTPIPAVVRWVCGMLVIVPLFVALVSLLRLGIEYLLFALFIVWFADGGAYFIGKKFGRVKLAPAISPGKTWEGAVGGFFLVAVLAVAAASWLELSVAVLLPFCLAVAAISIVGDLTVSMFKRTVGLKDSGSLFPGHGGVLDRIDSIAAAGPLFALGLDWLGLA